MRDIAGVTEQTQIRWLRQAEAETGTSFLQDDLVDLPRICGTKF